MLRGLSLWFLLACAPASPPGFNITFRVEGDERYGSDIIAYHDEPLIFTVSLSNRTLQDNQEWNRSADEYLANVAADFKAGKMSKEEYEKEAGRVLKGKKPLQIDKIGTEASPWHKQIELRIDGDAKRLWPATLTLNSSPAPVLVLDEKAYVLMHYATTPEQMLQLKHGPASIVVSLGDAQSERVCVTILPEKMPPEVMNARKTRAKLSRFYREVGDGDKALTHAQAVVTMDPSSIGGFILRGEAYIAKKKFKAALADFERALVLHDKKYPPGDENEPSEYLWATIGWLKEQK